METGESGHGLSFFVCVPIVCRGAMRTLRPARKRAATGQSRSSGFLRSVGELAHSAVELHDVLHVEVNDKGGMKEQLPAFVW